MHRATWLQRTFLAATGLQVATIFFDRRLVPYCGTVAVSALLAVALSSPLPASARRWTHYAAVAGLTLLTATAFLADHRTGGYGWSTEIAGGDSYSIRFGMPGSGPLVVEAVLLVVGAAALAVAVLGRVERLLRWRHVPGVLLGLLFLASAAEEATHPLMFGLDIPPDPRLRLLVFIPVALVIAALWLAANAALTSRGTLRPAGAGLLAVVALATTSFACLKEIEALQPQPGPVATFVLRYDTPGTVSPGKLAVEYFDDLLPPTPEEALSQALIRDVARESGVGAVPHPPSWTGGATDWARARPALKATLIAAGLLALVLSLFPAPELSRQPRRRSG